MANDPRQLRHSEKTFNVWSSERSRDKAQAQRMIEGLSQNDQIIFFLREQANMMAEQTQLLRNINHTLSGIQAGLNHEAQSRSRAAEPEEREEPPSPRALEASDAIGSSSGFDGPTGIDQRRADLPSTLVGDHDPGMPR